MSNYDFIAPRKRKQTLLIVEGNHEKNELMALLIKCFSELSIEQDNIIIYGTNIYQLYNDIVNYYGEDWQHQDVDLAYLVSAKKNFLPMLTKKEFVNILLIFDYERHDPYFAEKKICELQSYFMDVTDVGKLYLNYPMVESYQHFDGMPDEQFEHTYVSVTVQPGKEYKALVRDSYIAKLVEIPQKLDEILEYRFHVADSEWRSVAVEQMLSLKYTTAEWTMENVLCAENVKGILEGTIISEDMETVTQQVLHTLGNLKYSVEDDYYAHMRCVFAEIILQNIYKTRKIQGLSYFCEQEQLPDYFYRLNLLDILKRQNECSRDSESGIIWVLNTCVLFVADYNLNLLRKSTKRRESGRS